MTRRVIGSVFFGIWLGCFTAAAQLPPEIMVDRYLLQAERLMESKDPKGALELMGKIVALRKEHGLILPNEFHFKYAEVALSAGEVQEALEAVNTYLLKAGRGSKNYQEALELLEEAENREQFQSWMGTDRTCAEQPAGTACWMELTSHPDCYVWTGSLPADATATWTGECSEGRAQGEGTLKWVYDDDHYGETIFESTGSIADGKKHGHWTLREFSKEEDPPRHDLRTTEEGPYVDGKKHGRWIWRMRGGSFNSGFFVDGKQHGHWVFRRLLKSTIPGRVGRVLEDVLESGFFVDGKRHGYWVWHSNGGNVQEGPYVEGERHGHWVEHQANGGGAQGPWVDGKRHGQWVVQRPNGDVEKWTFKNGERLGEPDASSSQARQSTEDFNACITVSNCAKEGTRVCIENRCSQPAFVRFCTQDLGGRYTLALCGSVTVRAKDGFIHQGSVDHSAETYWRGCPWDKAKGTKEQACYFELPP